MGPVVDIVRKSGVPEDISVNRQTVLEFISFSEKNQNAATLTGLGEPKFNADGTVFNDPWGRPQNDGPALRAILLSRFTKSILEGKSDRELLGRLYKAEIPANSVLKRDLEYTAHHWRDASYDVWEEVKGQHFYTLMVQRRALIEGADIAERMRDKGAADFYREQVKQMEEAIRGHWEGDFITSTRNRAAGLDYKKTGLDAATILGALHGNTRDKFFAVSSDAVLATAAKLRDRFANDYEIAKRKGLGVPIGRYPEDRYDGVSTSSNGNPWPLLTHGFAELHYIAAREFVEAKSITITELNRSFFAKVFPWPLKAGDRYDFGTERFRQAITFMRRAGDMYILRVQAHAAKDGSVAEQMQRNTGFQMGAADLTWNYASLLSAVKARRKIPSI